MQAIPATQPICKRPRQAARCAGSPQGQTDARASQYAANGFLKHSFLPLHEPAPKLPPQHEVEMGYYSSLALLSRAHGLCIKTYEDKPYPYNVLLSYHDAKRELNLQPVQTSLHIVRDDMERTRLATKQQFDPDHMLYYVPVMPLFRLLRKPEQRQTAELLLSVMAYLYHVAKVPYYRNINSYLHYYYEINRDWLIECAGDYDTEEYEENMSDIIKAEYIGDDMERKLRNPYQLQQFANRLNGYHAIGQFQQDCKRIATEASEMLQAYPEATVFRNVQEVDPDGEVASFEPFVSFVADVDGWLYDNIERSINDELQEYGDTAQPCKTQVFDNPDITKSEGLEFEYRLFELINDLTYLLTHVP